MAIDPITIGLATGAVGLGFFSEREAQKKKNSAVQARVASLNSLKKARTETFEFESLNRYWGAESAGAQRLARVSGAGYSSGFASGALGHLDKLAGRRDVFLREQGHKQQLLQIDAEIASLERQTADPTTAGMLTALETGLKLGATWGPDAFTKPDPTKAIK